MRSCLFCPARADSLEDAWPRWITDQFKGPRPSEVRAERGGTKLKPWSTLQPELTIRCVCQARNNGWMSQLESKVQLFLQPLLTGQSGTVDITSQAVIALWVVQTSMVLEGLNSTEKQMYTQEYRERLRSSAAIPWRTSIWLAGIGRPAWFMSTKNRHIGVITSFQKMAPFTLRLQFDDDTSQIIDFRPVLKGEIYGPLEDPTLFDQVRIDPEIHTLVWPNGADFDPAILHNWAESAPALNALAEQWVSPKQILTGSAT